MIRVVFDRRPFLCSFFKKGRPNETVRNIAVSFISPVLHHCLEQIARLLCIVVNCPCGEAKIYI